MGLFEVSGVWMHAIGKTTIHSLWFGLLVLALLRLLLAHIPARWSRWRYGISVSALLLLFIACIGMFITLYEPLSSGVDAIAPAGAHPLESGREQVINSSLIFTLSGYIYLAGVLFMLFRSMASVTYLKGLRKSGTQVAPAWQLRFTQIGKSLGIKKKVDFLESARVQSPLLLGYLKPAVIVPAGMLSMLPFSQVEAILMHELYHLKRRDYLVNIMQLFIEGLLFYHPVVWIISGFIRSEREHCCDDRVLNATDNPVNYAKALISIAEQQHYTRLAPGAVGSAKQQFYSRIRRILNSNTMKTTMREKVLALALLAGSLVLLLTVSGFSAGPAFRWTNETSSEKIPEAVDLTLLADTIPQKSKKAENAEAREIGEMDWESMKEEMEEARLEALEALEEIDWESLKKEMDEARLEVLEEMDWESLKEEINEARLEAIEEIESIDWEEVRAEMEHSLSEMKLDMEELKMEISDSMKEIDWEEIREDFMEDLEKAKLSLDSIKRDRNL